MSLSWTITEVQSDGQKEERASLVLLYDFRLFSLTICSSAGHQHALLPGCGPYAVVPAALSPRRHPEEAHGQDLGEHPARAGTAHLAAVPQNGRPGHLWYSLLPVCVPSQLSVSWKAALVKSLLH